MSFSLGLEKNPVLLGRKSASHTQGRVKSFLTQFVRISQFSSDAPRTACTDGHKASS